MEKRPDYQNGHGHIGGGKCHRENAFSLVQWLLTLVPFMLYNLKKFLEMLSFPKCKFTVLTGLAVWCGCWTSSEYSLSKRTSRQSKDHGKIVSRMLTCWYKVVFN